MTGGPGFAFNTFTIVARCETTGALGICLASSPLNVAARCPYVRVGVGAVSTQANTNPKLGPAALDLLEAGHSPAEVIETLRAQDEWIDYRQIGIVDVMGRSAVFTGDKTNAWTGHETGPGFVAMGNKLVGEHVVAAIAESFRSSAAEPLLEERLMGAIEAGRDAGGQEIGHLSGRHGSPRQRRPPAHRPAHRNGQPNPGRRRRRGQRSTPRLRRLQAAHLLLRGMAGQPGHGQLESMAEEERGVRGIGILSP